MFLLWPKRVPDMRVAPLICPSLLLAFMVGNAIGILHAGVMIGKARKAVVNARKTFDDFDFFLCIG